MFKHFASATLVAIVASSAAAETSFSLKCVPQSASAVDGANPITSIEINTRGRSWIITHVAKNGARYDRNSQYKIQDISEPGIPMWEGAYMKFPHLKMVGRLTPGRGGAVTYTEAVFDANAGGRQTYEMTAYCEANSNNKGSCGLLAVESRDGWAQVRGEPSTSGNPLWRITNGMMVTWCGKERMDSVGRNWKWVAYHSTEGVHEGWVAARLLAESTASDYVGTGLQPSSSEFSDTRSAKTVGGAEERVQMEEVGGVYVVPVRFNGAITLNAVVDSGASEVSIPRDVALTLVRTHSISESDFLGTQTYVLADGSKVPSLRFRLQSLKVGNKTLENVAASIAPESAQILLGQSFLGRFKSWSVDNSGHFLILK